MLRLTASLLVCLLLAALAMLAHTSKRCACPVASISTIESGTDVRMVP